MTKILKNIISLEMKLFITNFEYSTYLWSVHYLGYPNIANIFWEFILQTQIVESEVLNSSFSDINIKNEGKGKLHEFMNQKFYTSFWRFCDLFQ